MANIDNVRRIIKEDFDSEYSDLIDKLAFTLNSHMEQVTDALNGNLSIDNSTSNIITILMEVDAEGTPKVNGSVKTGVSKAIGMMVIKAINQDDSDVYPESNPFISFDLEADASIMNILNISGLQEDTEYSLTIKIFS